MALELQYTSVSKGLKPGASGFCTVAVTSGMTTPMIQRLESLSGYRPVYRVGSPEEKKNPTDYAHWRAKIGGRSHSILSRVCFAGTDYSQRSNKFAHHLVLDQSEQTPAGPAWVMMQPGAMAGEWAGEPRIIATGRSIPSGSNELRVCEAWAEATGDAGWAGKLAESILLDSSKPAYILYKPGTDLLPLLNEAIALLPEHVRWRVTFSTFFNQLPAGLSCAWRCCVLGTPAAEAASRHATSGIVIDVTSSMGRAPDSRYVTMARTGQSMPEEEKAISPPAAPVSRVRGGLRKTSTPARVGASTQPATPQISKLLAEAGARQSAIIDRTTTGVGNAQSTIPRRRKALLWGALIGWPILMLFIMAGLLISFPAYSKLRTFIGMPLPKQVEESYRKHLSKANEPPIERTDSLDERVTHEVLTKRHPPGKKTEVVNRETQVADTKSSVSEPRSSKEDVIKDELERSKTPSMPKTAVSKSKENRQRYSPNTTVPVLSLPGKSKAEKQPSGAVSTPDTGRQASTGESSKVLPGIVLSRGSFGKDLSKMKLGRVKLPDGARLSGKGPPSKESWKKDSEVSFRFDPKGYQNGNLIIRNCENRAKNVADIHITHGVLQWSQLDDLSDRENRGLQDFLRQSLVLPTKNGNEQVQFIVPKFFSINLNKLSPIRIQREWKWGEQGAQLELVGDLTEPWILLDLKPDRVKHILSKKGIYQISLIDGSRNSDTNSKIEVRCMKMVKNMNIAEDFTTFQEKLKADVERKDFKTLTNRLAKHIEKHLETKKGNDTGVNAKFRLHVVAKDTGVVLGVISVGEN